MLHTLASCPNARDPSQQFLPCGEGSRALEGEPCGSYSTHGELRRTVAGTALARRAAGQAGMMLPMMALSPLLHAPAWPLGGQVAPAVLLLWGGVAVHALSASLSAGTSTKQNNVCFTTLALVAGGLVDAVFSGA